MCAARMMVDPGVFPCVCVGVWVSLERGCLLAMWDFGENHCCQLSLATVCFADCRASRAFFETFVTYLRG